MYAGKKKEEWYIQMEKVEHNYLTVVSEAFVVNWKFQVDKAIIKDNNNIYIPSIETLV